MNWIDAVFQKLLSGHQILTGGRMDGWMHARTDRVNTFPLHYSLNDGGINMVERVGIYLYLFDLPWKYFTLNLEKNIWKP